MNGEKMRKTALLALLPLLVFTACMLDNTNQSLNTDTELIEAIQLADNKESISVAELPLEIKTVLNRDYGSYVIESAKRIPQLGYLVSTLYNSVHEDLYFTQSGRKLDGSGRQHGHNDNNRGPHGHQHGWQKELPFDFVYPISLLMPDSTTISIVAEDDSLALVAINTWYLDNPESMQRPQLQFPLTVLLEDSLITLLSQEELEALLETCRHDENGFRGGNDDDRDGFGNGHQGNDGDMPGWGGNSPLEFVYPITLILPDSTMIDISSEDDSLAFILIRAWYNENPETLVRPRIQFPVDVMLQDSLVTLNSQEELETLLETFRDGRGNRDGNGFHGGNDDDQGGFGEGNGNHDGNGRGGNGNGGKGRGGNGNGGNGNNNGNGFGPDNGGLFDFVYPITFLMPDSSLITLNSKEDIQLIQHWYSSNPDNDGKPQLQFPVDVIVDEETMTINNEEEMQALKQELNNKPRGGRNRP
jgi:hypothetical protein